MGQDGNANDLTGLHNGVLKNGASHDRVCRRGFQRRGGMITLILEVPTGSTMGLWKPGSKYHPQ